MAYICSIILINKKRFSYEESESISFETIDHYADILKLLKIGINI